MVTKFRYQGYEYELIPKEAIPAYAESNTPIFVIGNFNYLKNWENVVYPSDFFQKGMFFFSDEDRFDYIMEEIKTYKEYYSHEYSIIFTDYHWYVGKMIHAVVKYT